MNEEDNAPDALFFHQLLLPICKTSGIDGDPRQHFCPQVAQWSNLCAIGELDLGCGTGHDCVNTNPHELIHWDGALMKDGVRGGGRGGILRRFDDSRDDNRAFDKEITDSVTKTRWLDIERVCKLCNNSKCPKQGETGCDPAHKHSFICDRLAKSVNAIRKKQSRVRSVWRQHNVATQWLW